VTSRNKTGYCRGEASQHSVLTTQQVIDIFLSHDKADYLAAKHNIHRTTVYNIWNKRSWSHITSQLKKETRRVNAIRVKDVKVSTKS